MRDGVLGENFYSSSKLTVLEDDLPPGFYEGRYDHGRGQYFLKARGLNDQNLINVPDSLTDKVIQDIKNFWDREAFFRRYKFAYKRGILMFGPPGCGKSSTISLVCREVINNGGYVMNFNNLGNFEGGLEVLKRIQPRSPVVALLEDLDQIIYNEDVSSILNLLDGVGSTIDNVVYLATTNFPEKLAQNVKNRPSRFDRRFEFLPPNAGARKMYLESLILDNDLSKKDILTWVKDSEGFSFAHLKELFISVVVFGNPYTEILKEMEEMKKDKSSLLETSSSDDEDGDKYPEEVDE